ncbi:MAG: hypothetical protein ACK5XX_06775 [Holosporales bacterium]
MHSTFNEIHAVLSRYTLSTIQPAASSDAWLAALQRQPGLLLHPRLAVYSGRLDTVFSGMYRDEKGEVVKLCASSDADLRFYELSDGYQDAGAGEAAAATTLCYGMVAVEPGVDVLLLCGDNRLDAQVAAQVAAHCRSISSEDVLTFLLKLQDAALFACIGALMAAGFARIPVLAEGITAQLAVSVMEALHTGGSSHVGLVNPTLPVQADMPQWTFPGKPVGYAALLALQEVQLLAAERYAGLGSSGAGD